MGYRYCNYSLFVSTIVCVGIFVRKRLIYNGIFFSKMQILPKFQQNGIRFKDSSQVPIQKVDFYKNCSTRATTSSRPTWFKISEYHFFSKKHIHTEFHQNRIIFTKIFHIKVDFLASYSTRAVPGSHPI